MNLVRSCMFVYFACHAITIISGGRDEQVNESSRLLAPNKKAFISCPIPDHYKSSVQKAFVGGLFVLACGSFAAVIIDGLAKTPCYVDFNHYPICDSTTVDGVDQNQVVLANYYGNIVSGTVLDSKHMVFYTTRYADGYCDKPLKTVCTHFNVTRYPDLPPECAQITNGKLLGVALASKKIEDTLFLSSDCGDAPAKIEKHFKATGKRYCKISPEQVGFTRLKHILLTLYLLDMNATSEFVSDMRWGNPDGIGRHYGPNRNCKATWSRNVDPSARLHAAQTKETVYKQKVMNRTNLLKRHNKAMQKNQTKFVKKYR